MLVVCSASQQLVILMVLPAVRHKADLPGDSICAYIHCQRWVIIVTGVLGAMVFHTILHGFH